MIDSEGMSFLPRCTWYLVYLSKAESSTRMCTDVWRFHGEARIVLNIQNQLVTQIQKYIYLTIIFPLRALQLEKNNSNQVGA
jgi:hypothetical protein